MIENIIIGICIVLMILAAVYAFVFLEGPDRGKKEDDNAMTVPSTDDGTAREISQNLSSRKKHKKRKR